MHIRNLSLIALSSLVVGCSYSDSALQYATEGSKRVDAGYNAKIEMTKHLTAYLEKANQGCGVKVEIINGTPVTSVKECIRLDDAMASVDKVEIVKPQQVKDMLDSMGDFAMKATNLVVPVASIYYGYQTNKDNQSANIAIRQSDNTAQSSMWSSYTDNFENTTSTSTATTNTSTATTNTSTSVDNATTNTTTIPSISVDANSTSVNP